MRPEDLETVDDRTPQECASLGVVRPRPPVVCLIGSTRFKQAFIQANFEETLKGHIVLSVGWFSHADRQVHETTPAEKRVLDELHLRKIDWSDWVRCLNLAESWCPNCRMWCREWEGHSRCCAVAARRRGYVGPSTLREIDYARRSGKDVRFDEPFFDPRECADPC